MKQRIIGFDLARAYAILGMFIVNFNTVFGAKTDNSFIGQFLLLFNGNSSSVFVMLAGMGIALMSNRTTYTLTEKTALQITIVKRSLFLFITGLLLCLWWPADILHFYAGYMCIAACVLFLPKRVYLYIAALTVLIFHVLLICIPYERGWNFETLQYTGFWTFNGFMRNTFYNGWNAIFPWAAYFLFGMWLGRLNWSIANTQKRMFSLGFFVFVLVEGIQFLAPKIMIDKDVLFYLTADYIPPFLPFMLATAAFGLMLIAGLMYLGNYVENNKVVQAIAATGKMTLSHYVSHLVIGILLFTFIQQVLSVNHYNQRENVSPIFILLFSIAYFIISVCWSWLWLKKFKNGPLEMLMRKISG
ncbi:DUF418 domain-containing protein [Pedobacter sp. Hv1]|uniref:DUF418 domain-containing protein n=1 Tax=Pedobacter sp. Hv1 TaxID=1740090 RepID=UPI0006D8C2B4|nr:DUF418 domain-containing protein [Pedobacter sp. Hv1]KQC00843.1 hypothetical protein AQF98_09195 [Pedobacter sp. Hv1]